MKVRDKLAALAYAFKSNNCLVPFDEQGELLKADIYEFVDKFLSAVEAHVVSEDISDDEIEKIRKWVKWCRARSLRGTPFSEADSEDIAGWRIAARLLRKMDRMQK